MSEEQVVPETQILPKTKNQEFVESLRELADFYENHQQLAVPDKQTINIFRIDIENIKKFIHSYKGNVSKNYASNYFYVTLPFGQMINLDLNTNREQVCERIVTKKTVLKQVPVSFETKEVEEESIEWKCSESIFESTE